MNLLASFPKTLTVSKQTQENQNSKKLKEKKNETAKKQTGLDKLNNQHNTTTDLEIHFYNNEQKQSKLSLFKQLENNKLKKWWRFHMFTNSSNGIALRKSSTELET